MTLLRSPVRKWARHALPILGRGFSLSVAVLFFLSACDDSTAGRAKGCFDESQACPEGLTCQEDAVGNAFCAQPPADQQLTPPSPTGGDTTGDPPPLNPPLMGGAIGGDEPILPQAGEEIMGGTEAMNNGGDDPLPPQGGEDEGGEEPVDEGICPEVRVLLKPTLGSIPQVMLVVDRSYSMINTEDRWTPVFNGLTSVTANLEESVQFGLVLFPDPQRGAPDPQAIQECINNGRTSLACDFIPSPDCETALCTDDYNACTPGRVMVPPAHETAQAISGQLQTNGPAPDQGTPTASALRAAGDALIAAGGSNQIILLATDGAPGCNFGINPTSCDCLTSLSTLCASDRFATMCLDDEETVAEIEALRGRGIDTIVLGITLGLNPEGPCIEGNRCPYGAQRCEGGMCVNLTPRVLDAMAVAGGRAVNRRHLQVTDLNELQQRLTQAAGSVAPCRYDLGEIPPEFYDRLVVTLDGMEIMADPNRTNGWSVEGREIILHGPACEALRDGQPHGLGVSCR